MITLFGVAFFGAILSAMMFGQCMSYVHRDSEQAIWLCCVFIGIVVAFGVLGKTSRICGLFG